MSDVAEGEPPVKRSRGRPRKPNSLKKVVDPNIPKRGRGRPRKIVTLPPSHYEEESDDEERIEELDESYAAKIDDPLPAVSLDEDYYEMLENEANAEQENDASDKKENTDDSAESMKKLDSTEKVTTKKTA